MCDKQELNVSEYVTRVSYCTLHLRMYMSSDCDRLHIYSIRASVSSLRKSVNGRTLSKEALISGKWTTSSIRLSASSTVRARSIMLVLAWRVFRSDVQHQVCIEMTEVRFFGQFCLRLKFLLNPSVPDKGTLLDPLQHLPCGSARLPSPCKCKRSISDETDALRQISWMHASKGHRRNKTGVICCIFERHQSVHARSTSIV